MTNPANIPGSHRAERQPLQPREPTDSTDGLVRALAAVEDERAARQLEAIVDDADMMLRLQLVEFDIDSP